MGKTKTNNRNKHRFPKKIDVKNNKNENRVEFTFDHLKNFATILADDLKNKKDMAFHLFNGLNKNENLLINCIGGTLFSHSVVELKVIIGEEAAGRFYTKFDGCRSITVTNFPNYPECLSIPYDENLNCLL